MMKQKATTTHIFIRTLIIITGAMAFYLTDLITVGDQIVITILALVWQSFEPLEQ